MKLAVPVLFVCAVFLAMPSAPVHAEDRVAAPPVHPAQAQYDLYVDEYGRRWLVDPYTGEIVARARPERRLRRPDRIRRQRDALRERRRRRLDRQLGRRFDDDGYERDPYYDEDYVDRRPRDGRGRYLDEIERDRAPRRERRRRVEREPLPEPRNEQRKQEEVARLPEPAPTRNRRVALGIPKPPYGREQMVALQVVLDRAGFSPGVIDGQWGSNVAKAMKAWQEAKGENKLADPAVLASTLAASGGDAFTTYTITGDDIAGPFVPNVPIDYARKAQMKRLAFTSVEEMLAERFHMSEAYLRKLNEGKNFRRAGTNIRIVQPGPKARRKVHYLIADKGLEQLRAYDRNGNLLTAYPATIGSQSTPSPSGKHTIERIAFNPEYTYNPKINFQQGSNDKILTIPPGPNGPVGSVWIALSKPTYGIHGTPDPARIGKTNSNGCIRLTNWDAQELAKLVSEGVTVEFTE